MPCRDDGYPQGPSYVDQFHELTRLLCELCARVESWGYSSVMPHDVAVWWTQHKAADRKREADEIERAKRGLEEAEENLLKAKRELAAKQAKIFSDKKRGKK